MRKVVLLFLILTVFASGAYAVDWWDNDWTAKFAINSMVVSTDLNTINWVNLEKVDFSTLSSACSNAADITVVNESTQEQVTDLNFQGWDGTNTDGDVNVLFKLTEALVANTYDGTYYFYSKNGACPAPTNRQFDQSGFDDFEDGDSTANSFWFNANSGGVPVVTVEGGDAAFRGSFGLKIALDASEFIEFQTNTFNGSGLPKPPYTVCTWIKSSDVSIEDIVVRGIAGGVRQWGMGFKAGDFVGDNTGGTTYTAWVATPANDTWYKMCVDNTPGAVITFRIYDSSETFIESFTEGGARIANLTSTNITSSAGIGESADTFFDNVGVEKPRTSTFVLGGEETSLDFNVTTINGLSFLTHPIFAFGIDGNITVDFNVFQTNNERLSLDLNNSPSVIQGSGAVIVEDLNLDSSICPDQDWNDEPSECSFSWDYSGVTDGNYTIIGLLNNSDFNAGDGNFEIANDVNLVISVPINEETNELINVIESTFTVRINAGGILSVFPDQIDVNGFPVPISSSFILVEIDTNTPSLFNSRVYAFSFTEPQPSETLQPYLPPVVASILTTVKTLQFENLNPIPNVRLQVFKDLPTGRTLIHDSVTDGKGETTIPFIVADLYEIDVLVDGVLIFTESYIATATTNEHFIFISSTGAVVPPSDITTPSVFFTPAQSHFNTIDVNLGVVVSTDLANIAAIHFFITNADFNIWDGGLDTAAPADGNTYSININDLADVSDTNRPFISTVIVILTDGNTFSFSASYSIRPGGDEILNILMYDMRDEFGCNTSDLSVRCDGLMFIAFFIILFLLCALSAGARGLVGGPGLSLIGLILTMFFVVIAWIPMWLGIVMVFAAMGVILTRTRFIGA